MNKKQKLVASKAGRLIQAIEAAFKARATVGNEKTLLTLAYSTDP